MKIKQWLIVGVLFVLATVAGVAYPRATNQTSTPLPTATMEMEIEINATNGAESLAAEMGLELLDIQKWFGAATRVTVKHVREFAGGN